MSKQQASEYMHSACEKHLVQRGYTKQTNSTFSRNTQTLTLKTLEINGTFIVHLKGEHLETVQVDLEDILDLKEFPCEKGKEPSVSGGVLGFIESVCDAADKCLVSIGEPMTRQAGREPAPSLPGPSLQAPSRQNQGLQYPNTTDPYSLGRSDLDPFAGTPGVFRGPSAPFDPSSGMIMVNPLI
jgi:hypothetical protein